MLRIKMRAGVLALLALFIVSGIAASTSSAAGPYWKVNGTKLVGTRQIKLQLKSATAVLKSEKLGLEVVCHESISEGATIEGTNIQQGQAKGRVSYDSCEVLNPSTCKVNEPITTRPTKSFLAVNEGAQQNIVDVYAPTEGNVFVELTFTGTSCPTTLKGGPVPVDGSIYAELVPHEGEVQEGLLNFPLSPVAEVKHEGTLVKVGLTVGGSGNAATFSGTYGARLANFPEKFGASLL